MKWITIQLMKYNLRMAKKSQAKKENYIIRKAYDMLIQNYEDTIMFLKADS